MDISISICPTHLEVGSEGDMYDEAALLDGIRKFIATRFGKAANITCLQVGFRQGDQWARIDGDAFAGQELLSEFFGLYGSNEELFVPQPEPVNVELAVANETIRHCAVEEFTGLEHPAMEEACQAYRSAVIEALADDPRAERLNVVSPRGQRILHSQWCGAHFSWTRGAMGVMSGKLTEDEKAALDAADDAGRDAAKNEVAAEEVAE